MAKRFTDTNNQDTMHFLYFMVPKVPEIDRIKIGLTTNVDKRRAALSAACGQEMVCIWTIGVARRDWAFGLEKLIHQVLGEWFKFNPEVLGFPDYLKEQGFGEGLAPFKEHMKNEIERRKANHASN